MSDIIIEFITARWDEREALARAAVPGPWIACSVCDAPELEDDPVTAWQIWGDPVDYDGAAGYSVVAVTDVLIHDFDSDGQGIYQDAEKLRPSPEHIAANDPAYVLADIAAKRQILALHVKDGGFCVEDEMYAQRYPWPCETVALLAAPFAGHPDFDPSWGQLRPWPAT